MRVVKCINNNVVLCLDHEDHEWIVMGRGLGYAHRPGGKLDETKAEKRFRMATPEETRKLGDLLSTLPQREIDLCSRIVDKAAEELRLNPSVYLTLTDHVCFAIQRSRQGTVFQNTLLPEVRTFYPREYALGKYALELILQEMGIRFPDDEAANIALHLVNAEYENSLSDTLRITQTLHDILSMLQARPGLSIDPESRFYTEFTVQLKFLVFRAFAKEFYRDGEPSFVQMVERCYQKEYACAQDIAHILWQRCGSLMPPAEQAFLAASLHRTCKPQHGALK